MISLVLVCAGFLLLTVGTYKMSQAFDSLKTQVDSAITVMKQASDTITALVAKLPAGDVVDPQALTDAANALSAASTSLSAAVSSAPQG